MAHERLDAFNAALVDRAVAAYEHCWRSRRAEVRQPTALGGSWRTTANMLFFRQQLAYWRERGYAEHLGPLQRSSEFAELLHAMRAAAAEFLTAHGAADGNAIAASAPLFCWASVHMDASSHPPHVHSDAAVTGTYYARRPTSAAPLCLEDPRGRSPLDLVAGLEHRLRYGGSGGGSGGGAVSPFDGVVRLEPVAGECVLFPPWLVHSVPPGPAAEYRCQGAGRQGGEALAQVGVSMAAAEAEPAGLHGELLADDPRADAHLRVSFSFNLLGKWGHTAQRRMHGPSSS